MLKRYLHSIYFVHCMSCSERTVMAGGTPLAPRPGRIVMAGGSPFSPAATIVY